MPQFGRRVTDVLRGMLRPALIPAPGKKFVVADWSAIEGRVNPWLSGRGEDKLQQFRDKLDPYIVNASQTFSVPYGQVNNSQRQVGKVQELACGFGGGVGAFAAMGRVSPDYYVQDGVIPRTKLPVTLRRIDEIGRRYG